MDVLSIVLTVARRWYVSVPIMLAALIAAMVAQSNVPPEYASGGSVLLANPEIEPERLPYTPQALERIISDVEDRANSGALTEAAVTADVRRADDSSVRVTVETATEAEAGDAIAAISDSLAADLRAYQIEKGLPEEDRTEVIPGALDVLVGLPEEDEFEEQLEGADDIEADEDGLGAPADGMVQVAASVFLSDPTAGYTNPFGATAQTARVLEVTLQSDEGRLILEERAGRTVDFSVMQGTRDVAPIVEISTFGSSPQVVLADFDLVVEVLAEELDSRQERAQVPESRRVFIEVLAAPQTVEDISPPVSRLTAAIVGLGALLALGVALVVESLLSRRSRGPKTDDDQLPLWDPLEDDPLYRTGDPSDPNAVAMRSQVGDDPS